MWCSQRLLAIVGMGVFDNFWKLIERWGITFVITVPTAISALMQRPVDADISTVKTSFSGSAPLPLNCSAALKRQQASQSSKAMA